MTKEDKVKAPRVAPYCCQSAENEKKMRVRKNIFEIEMKMMKMFNGSDDDEGEDSEIINIFFGK